MSEQTGTRKTSPISRAILVLVAIGIIILAMAGRRAGLIGFEEVGGMQLALVGLAIFLIGIAILNEGMLPVYQTIAVILLNTALLLLLVELMVILSFNLQFSVRDAEKVPVQDEATYFKQVGWGQEYWEEHRAIDSATYAPYVTYQQTAYSGKHINIDNNGIRLTPNNQCDTEDAYTIFMFGGSTMWGMGAPNWGTIPAYLQERLNEEIDAPICIVNQSQLGYVSTQEVIQLTLELQKGNVPDMVIFYDGINDTISAFNNNVAGVPRNNQTIANALKNTPPTGLFGWINGTYTARFIQAWRQKSEPGEFEESTQVSNNLAQDIVDVYQGNYEVVQALAESYDFDFYFVWQPVLVVTDKPLVEDEPLLIQVPPPVLNKLYKDTWALAEALAEGLPSMVDTADIFDGNDSYIYFDHVHVVPEGNEIVANSIADMIINDIQERLQ